MSQNSDSKVTASFPHNKNDALALLWVSKKNYSTITEMADDYAQVRSILRDYERSKSPDAQ